MVARERDSRGLTGWGGASTLAEPPLKTFTFPRPWEDSVRYAALRRSALIPIVAVAGIVVFCAGGAAAATVQPHATTYNVKDYGAKADGKTNNAPAIDQAIAAANKAGGGTV